MVIFEFLLQKCNLKFGLVDRPRHRIRVRTWRPIIGQHAVHLGVEDDGQTRHCVLQVMHPSGGIRVLPVVPLLHVASQGRYVGAGGDTGHTPVEPPVLERALQERFGQPDVGAVRYDTQVELLARHEVLGVGWFAAHRGVTVREAISCITVPRSMGSNVQVPSCSS